MYRKEGEKSWRTSAASLAKIIIMSAIVMSLSGSVFAKEHSLPIIIGAGSKLLLKIDDKKEPIVLSNKVISGEDEERASAYLYYGWKSPELMDHYPQFNDDYSKLFFADDRDENSNFSLYYRDMNEKASKWKKKQGVLLAENVFLSFDISGDGKQVVYRKIVEEDYSANLYFHNLKQETLVAKNVSNYWFSEVNSTIYYTQGNFEDYDLNLYSVHTGNPKKSVKIASDISHIEYVDDVTGTIYYSTYNSDHYPNGYALHSKGVNTKVKTLIEKYSTLVSIMSKGQIYYTRLENTGVPLAAFVEDDLLASDTDMKKPILSDYSSYSNPKQSYDQAIENYEEKIKRDELRKEIKDETAIESFWNLFLYNEGKSSKVANNYKEVVYSNKKNGLLLYELGEFSVANRIKLSELTSIDDIYDYQYEMEEEDYSDSEDLFGSSFGEENKPHRYSYKSYPREPDFQTHSQYDGLATYTHSVNSKESLLTTSDTDLLFAEMSDDGKQMYTHEFVSDNHQLVSYQIVNGLPTKRKVIVDDIYSFKYIPEDSTLWYLKTNEKSEIMLDLYQFIGGESKLIDHAVHRTSIKYYPDDSLLLYLKGENFAQAELYRYEKGSSTKAAAKVYGYFYTPDSKLYYLTNVNEKLGYGDIMQYNGNKKPTLFYKRGTSVSPTKYHYNFD